LRVTHDVIAAQRENMSPLEIRRSGPVGDNLTQGEDFGRNTQEIIKEEHAEEGSE